jgi:hypothetical protein
METTTKTITLSIEKSNLSHCSKIYSTEHGVLVRLYFSKHPKIDIICLSSAGTGEDDNKAQLLVKNPIDKATLQEIVNELLNPEIIEIVDNR